MGSEGASATAHGPAVATIDLSALRANTAEAVRLAGGRDLIAVVKADAYGHGAVAISRALVAAGCPSLAVWSVGEAVALRDAGIAAPLLVLGGVYDAEQAEEAVARALVPVLHDPGMRERMAAAGARGGLAVPVHVELDTGMHRMGVPDAAAGAFLAEIARDPRLSLAGVFTHFARADEHDLAPTREQLGRFAHVLAALAAAGIDPGQVHVANSAGLVALAELGESGAAQTAVRPGLLLYGAQPSAARAATLRPVMSLRAPVVALRRVGPGDPVGYGARYRAASESRIATIALGYADAVPIAATGAGEVWLAGARHPIAGRVSMDYVTVDVGSAPVSLGDRAVVFGSERSGGPAVLPVDDAAQAAGTLSYELLVRVGSRVRRVVEDGAASV